MRDNEGIYQVMNAVVYYSNTNQSKRIASHFAHSLGFQMWDIREVPCCDFDNLVLAFPIHCQGLPKVVEEFLAKCKMHNLTLIATYGRMCHGNALNEVQKRFKHNIIAGAYIPTRHSYLQDKEFEEFDKLDTIVQKVLAPSPIKIPKSYKNPFSDFLKKKRSQIGVKIIKTNRCNSCGLCTQTCNLNAIKNGVTNHNCIRCLKCVNACPNQALEFKLSSPMKTYLKKKRQDELVIYV